jgi:hypothetical protein
VGRLFRALDRASEGPDRHLGLLGFARELRDEEV